MVNFILILVIIAGAVVAYLGFKRARAKDTGASAGDASFVVTVETDQGPDRSRAAAIRRAAPPQWAAMDIGTALPALGEPGTATPAQLGAVRAVFGDDTPADLSFEQASLILDAREYARGVADALDREGELVDEDDALPAAVAFIVGNEPIREYVRKWGRGRFQRGTHYEPPRLRRNDSFAAVRSFMLQHFA